MQRLRVGRGVHHLEINRSFPGVTGDTRVNLRPSGCSQRRRQNHVSMVVAEHQLHVIRGRPVALERIIADQVRGPLAGTRVYVDQKRRIGYQNHIIRVALQASQPCRVTQCSMQVRGRESLLRSPFADEYFWTSAFVVVVVMNVVFERSGSPIIVLVDYIWRPAGDTGCRDHLKIRVSSLDRIVELGEASIVAPGSVKEIFVSDFDILERERRWMTVRGALRAPSGVGAAGEILDFIQGILYVWCQVRNESAIQRIAGINREYRLHIQVFAPFRKLKQTQTVIRAITPRTFMAGSLFDRPDGVLPFEPLVARLAFTLVASRNAPEGRLHCR